MKTLAERVRWAREVSGLSVNEAAARTDLTAAFLYMVEGGKKTNLTTRSLTAIAGAFGVSLDWLVNGSGPVPSERVIKSAAHRAA